MSLKLSRGYPQSVGVFIGWEFSGTQCVNKKNIYFDGLMENYKLFLHKKLVHTKLKLFKMINLSNSSFKVRLLRKPATFT